MRRPYRGHSDDDLLATKLRHQRIVRDCEIEEKLRNGNCDQDFRVPLPVEEQKLVYEFLIKNHAKIKKEGKVEQLIFAMQKQTINQGDLNLALQLGYIRSKQPLCN